MPRIEVEVEEMSFQFNSFAHWTAKGKSWFRRARLTSESSICVDALGRICISGQEFMRAEREGAYPIRVYGIPAFRRMVYPYPSDPIETAPAAPISTAGAESGPHYLNATGSGETQSAPPK